MKNASITMISGTNVRQLLHTRSARGVILFDNCDEFSVVPQYPSYGVTCSGRKKEGFS
jgi:hypothetical protein